MHLTLCSVAMVTVFYLQVVEGDVCLAVLPGMKPSYRRVYVEGVTTAIARQAQVC